MMCDLLPAHSANSVIHKGNTVFATVFEPSICLVLKC